MDDKPKVLLAEDDQNLGHLLIEFLEAKGFAPYWVKNGKEALEALDGFNPGIVILDVMMPEMDGFTAAEGIRKKDAQVPIIFLTAKSDILDKSLGFELGADDYLTKPFSMQELVMRIQAVLRRAGQHEPANGADQLEMRIGDFFFKYSTRELAHKGEIKKLTTKEADLLKLLAAKNGNLLPREEALQSIWGDDSWFNGRSMDVFISKLRKYLKQDTRIEILNVHGLGFKLLVKD